MPKKIDEALRQLPPATILALAESLHAITKAQVAAGKKLTPREQMILDEADALLPKLRNPK